MVAVAVAVAVAVTVAVVVAVVVVEATVAAAAACCFCLCAVTPQIVQYCNTRCRQLQPLCLLVKLSHAVDTKSSMTLNTLYLENSAILLCFSISSKDMDPLCSIMCQYLFTA